MPGMPHKRLVELGLHVETARLNHFDAQGANESALEALRRVLGLGLDRAVQLQVSLEADESFAAETSASPAAIVLVSIATPPEAWIRN